MSAKNDIRHVRQREGQINFLCEVDEEYLHSMIITLGFAIVCSIAFKLIHASALSSLVVDSNGSTWANDWSLSSLNISTNAPLTADPPPPLDIKCSGDHFGWNPNILDCESAKGHIIPDSIRRAWGERRTGLSDHVFGLPYRIMGGISDQSERKDLAH